MPNEYYADDPPKLPSTGDYTCGCIGGNHPVECSNCRGNIWSYGKQGGNHRLLERELSHQRANVGKQPIHEAFKGTPYNFASRIKLERWSSDTGGWRGQTPRLEVYWSKSLAMVALPKACLHAVVPEDIWISSGGSLDSSASFPLKNRSPIR
ncbi:hypothetical protein DHEL01_v211781 [Diaporthe helianthi]|uniref:Uncharacterized protein n=1 Tax=Diaporthe helianthi TaxID=158607 RepID=A0A2P5HHV4_DIAHE|nr:hypothetical protein DHEL01_v211781 [Diaporthe helianthi]